MKVVALLSGGKDSILALLMAYRYNHDPVVVANISPSLAVQTEGDHEVDSYMYQTVGHEAVEDLVQCLELPLRRGTVDKHRAVDQTLHYTEDFSEQDEVEDLYRLLKSVKEEFPEVEGVTSGAILSNYQRNRVEYVCHRLGLVSVAYLWRRQPREILDMATALQVRAILVKTASAGLVPKALLGKTLEDARPTLEKMETLYGGHMAGEGGEFESFVLSCPLFKKENLAVKSLRHVIVDDNDYSPSGHCVLTIERQNQTPEEQVSSSQLLKSLRGGKLCFPSDNMPWLPSTVPFSPPSHLIHLVKKYGENWSLNMQVKLLSVETCITGVHFDLFSLSILSSPLSSGAVVLHKAQCGVKKEEIEECIHSLLESGNGEPIYLFFDVPNMSFFELVDQTYCSSVRAIRPPGRTIFSSRTAKLNTSTIQLYALFSSVDTIEVVHNQSLSCWAAGNRGPYSQAWGIPLLTPAKPSEEEDAIERTYVLVGGMCGGIPSTGRLATVQDLPIAAQSDVTTTLSDFLSQFAYALSNALQYASLFGCTLKQSCKVTGIVRNVYHAYLIPFVIKWCVPELDITCVSIEVLVVSDLHSNKHIELFVEWQK